MKTYPSIDHKPQYGSHIYAFDKLDGSNIRAEWSRKKGFWKFGRRNGLLDHSNMVLLDSLDLIRAAEDGLAKVFTDQRWQAAVAFFEFHGPGSFAGNHVEDEPHQCTLIDVAADKRGILEPRQFLKLFSENNHAALLYQGTFNQTFEAQVREGALEGVTAEGVVCKGAYVSPGCPLMFKVKTKAWLDRLRKHCGDNQRLFESLR